MKFNHEKKGKYAVTVTATDTAGATASIRVDIYVNDVDEAPDRTGNMATTIEYMENGKDAVLTLSAGDPESAMPIVWSLPTGDPDDTGDLTATKTLRTTEIDFKISQDGMLSFMEFARNYESAADEGANNRLQRSGAGIRRRHDGHAEAEFKVVVNVSDVEEQGSIKLRPTAQTDTTLLQPQVGVGITAHVPDGW